MNISHSGPRGAIRALLALAALIACSAALADPPARVARMANLDGAVSFSPAGEEEWVLASANRPLITGDRVWVDADARAELQIGTLAVRLGSQTSVVILNLDDRVAQFQLQQGVLNVRVRSLGPDESIEVDTPLLAFSLRRPGIYRIDVDAATAATGIAVASGQGDVYGETVAYTIGERQWYRFADAALRDYQYDALPPADAFDGWTQALDRREDSPVAARYVSPEVIGYADLDQYGTWSVVEGYGNVWVPTAVASDWAPYSDGHWAWIEPWGWTWVDAAPWGFAPFHYGRWAYARERWCWVPGPRLARAVYAPALVVFVGGDSFRVSVGGGGPARGIAWFPLAPGEVYRPSYRVSRNYFTRVNVSNTNVTNVTITNVYNRPDAANAIYRNRNQRGAVTAMPATQFAQSRPVVRSAAPVARELAGTAPVTAVASIAPVRASVLGPGASGGASATRPPTAILKRPAVARVAPPPPPAPFSAREASLAKDPGRPADPAAIVAPRSSPTSSPTAPVVKVVPALTAGAAPSAPTAPHARTNAAAPGVSGAPPSPVPAAAPAAPPRPGAATPVAPAAPAPPRPAVGGPAPKTDGAPAPAPALAPAPAPPQARVAPPAPQPPRPPEARPPVPVPPVPPSGASGAPAPARPPAELRREPPPAPVAPAPASEMRREAPAAPIANRPPPSPAPSPPPAELRREPAVAPATPAVVPAVPPQPVVRPAPSGAPPPAQVRQPEAKAPPAKADAQKAKPDEKRDEPK